MWLFTSILPTSFFGKTAFAAYPTFSAFSGNIITLINEFVVFLGALALLGFTIGIVRFIGTAGDDKSRAEGKQLMLWGAISLFLLVGVWGVVRIIRITFFG